MRPMQTYPYLRALTRGNRTSVWFIFNLFDINLANTDTIFIRHNSRFSSVIINRNIQNDFALAQVNGVRP